MNSDEDLYGRDVVNRRIMTGIAVFTVVVIVIGGVLLWPSASYEDCNTITLYGFSVKGEVFDERIIPSFKDHWKNRTGEEINFETTYAGSGKITNQVIAGAPAEVMVLSTEWDAIQLERNGFVETDWRSYPYQGTISRSPWVILVREGNPKGITDFKDLTRDGIELVHADPLTSGGACWSVFSVYGSELRRSEVHEGFKNATAAEELLEGIMHNVISWQSSARKALSQFTLGYGDALITYEN
ncbi:MAG: substrate-binding domain-containing protein, partial [Candidatus Thermoplasmatota archaeon]|nr:substrate-binding domain-containing protein [Candidatus Thermoplasmatota archaeon]